MITHETAARIAYAHAEIKAARELLAIVQEAAKRGEPADIRDPFGRQRGLQLGVPSLSGFSHRLMDVSPALGAIVIEAHIGAKTREIEALTEIARGEIEAATKAPTP